MPLALSLPQQAHSSNYKLLSHYYTVAHPNTPTPTHNTQQRTARPCGPRTTANAPECPLQSWTWSRDASGCALQSHQRCWSSSLRSSSSSSCKERVSCRAAGWAWWRGARQTAESDVLQCLTKEQQCHLFCVWNASLSAPAKHTGYTASSHISTLCLPHLFDVPSSVSPPNPSLC